MRGRNGKEKQGFVSLNVVAAFGRAHAWQERKKEQGFCQ